MAGWPARFGASGWTLRPSGPWQTAQACAFARPAAASAASAASVQSHDKTAIPSAAVRNPIAFLAARSVDLFISETDVRIRRIPTLACRRLGIAMNDQ